MRFIEPRHLSFVEEAAKAFEDNPRQETHRNKDENLIALRYGIDRDCVMLYELGDCIGNFVQQVDVRVPHVRKEVARFSFEMEQQLRDNEHKGGWENSSYDFLVDKIQKQLARLSNSVSHSEFRRRCANIANFAMMLSDNDRREEAKNS